MLNVGGVIDTKFLRAQEGIGAILLMSQAGNIGGHALADVLTGKVSPSGHLTTTWAENYEDYPNAKTFSHMNGDIHDEYYEEGIYVGYRYYEKKGIQPAYPFGYGLSYTTFGYSDLKISKPVIGPQENITLSCTVKNTGKKAGDEVVQLYIRDDFSSVTTYDKVLRGFERIHLQPGEEQTVNFTLTPQDLGLWDKNNQFTVEPGSFSVMVGASSQDIRLKGSFEVQ